MNDDDIGTSSSGSTSPVNIFQHVTSLAANSDDGTTSPTVLAVLAYACIRLGHLSHDAFGDSRASKRLYKLAASIDPHPSGVSYHGIGTSVEASITHCFGRSNSPSSEGNIWREEMEKAVEAYKEAIKLGGGLGINGEVLFHLAVALEVCCSFYFALCRETPFAAMNYLHSQCAHQQIFDPLSRDWVKLKNRNKLWKVSVVVNPISPVSLIPGATSDGTLVVPTHTT